MKSSHDTQIPGRRPAEPCPFCGFPVPAGEARCGQCMLPLDERTLRALERLMGPWYVLESRTPSAPGVSWGKFCDLIAKGKIRPDSVVRGPATGGLWKLAQDTPSVATRLGLCWACHSPLPPVQALSDCPECGALLNGTMDWAEPQPAAGARGLESEPEPEPEASAAIEDLIQAGAGGGPASSGPAPAPRRRSSLFVGLVGLLAAASLGAGFGWSFLYFTRDRRRPPEPPPAEPAPTGRQEQGSRPGSDDPWLLPRPRQVPVGPLPGELFPDVPEYTGPIPPLPRPTTASRPEPPRQRDRLEKQRRSARRMFEKALAAEKAGDLMTAQSLLVKMINEHDARAHPKGAMARLKAVQDRIRATTRPADLPPPKELARQKRTAKILMATADELYGEGSLMPAQMTLLKVLNNHHRAAWPAGAVELLAAIQAKIRTSTRLADRLSAEELTRQQASAAKLFAQARPLLAGGNYLAAQKPLLKILNDHHPRAWPAGALEAFKKIQKSLGQAPSSAPSFFDIEARP